MRRNTLVALVLGCEIFLLGCGERKPNIGESQALKTLGFDNPITISVVANGSVDSDGNPSSDEVLRRMALLLRADALRISPNINGSPWWTFNVASGTLADGVITVPAGRRAVAGHSEEQSWSEGAVHYYAETISYNVEPVGGFSLGHSAVGPFSIRLILKNDPAVGHWEATSNGAAGSRFAQSDAAALAAELSKPDDEAVGRLRTAISQARRSAFDAIEQNLKATGVIERDPNNPDVLVSRRLRTAYYTKSDSNSSITLSKAAEACASLVARGYGSESGRWHLATSEEVKALLGVRPGGNQLPDAPDSRLWRNFIIPQGNYPPTLITATVAGNNGAEYQAPNLPPMYNPGVKIFHILSDGQLSANGYGLGIGDIGAPGDRVLVADWQSQTSAYRVLCITLLD